MTCEQFGQQACTENDRTADRIGLMLDQQDPRTVADTIRQELYDRPNSLALDLLDRIPHYDEPGVGADLKIEPVLRRDYGGRVYDTGDREVFVDSQQYGREKVAVLTGAPEQPYDDRYSRFPNQGQRFDPLSMITSLFVGHLMNGNFSRWQNQPHRRQYWQDQRGQMWYPQGSGQWGTQYRGGGMSYTDTYGRRDPGRFFSSPQQDYINPNQSQWPQRQPNWFRNRQQQQTQPPYGQDRPRYPVNPGQQPGTGGHDRWGRDQDTQPWTNPDRRRWTNPGQGQQEPWRNWVPGRRPGQDQPQPQPQPQPHQGDRNQHWPRRENPTLPPRQEQPVQPGMPPGFDGRRHPGNDGRGQGRRFDQDPIQRIPEAPQRHQQRELPRMQPPQPQPGRIQPQPQPHREIPRIQPGQQQREHQQQRGDRRQGR